MSVTHSQAAFNGAQQIIRQCLGMTEGQELLIIGDESCIEIVMVLLDAAEALAIAATCIFIPVAQQRRIPALRDLSRLSSSAGREANAILTCVSGLPETLPFRERILETHWGSRTKIGH